MTDPHTASPLAPFEGRSPDRPGWFSQALQHTPQRSGHEVQGARDAVPLPRLGEVEEGELFLATKFDLALEPAYPDNEPDEPEEIREDGRPVDRTAQLEAVRDNRAQETLKMITSLRMAAWVIAALLLIRLFV